MPLYKQESYNIIGACIDVHNELGFGYHESVYQEALAYEFSLRSIPYQKEAKLVVTYKGKMLNKYYIADFICYDRIILEVKAMSGIIVAHKVQLRNYLKTTGKSLGLLVNFGASSFQSERLIFSKHNNNSR